MNLNDYIAELEHIVDVHGESAANAEVMDENGESLGFPEFMVGEGDETDGVVVCRQA